MFSPLRAETRQRCLLFSLLFNIVLTREIRQEKENTRHPDWKEVKLLKMMSILYRNPKESTKNSRANK